MARESASRTGSRSKAAAGLRVLRIEETPKDDVGEKPRRTLWLMAKMGSGIPFDGADDSSKPRSAADAMPLLSRLPRLRDDRETGLAELDRISRWFAGSSSFHRTIQAICSAEMQRLERIAIEVIVRRNVWPGRRLGLEDKR